jgi:hypothetical protein
MKAVHHPYLAGFRPYFDLHPGKFFNKKLIKLENTGEIADFTRFSSNSRILTKKL